VNKLRSTELSIDKTQKHKRRVLTEEKSEDDIGTRLEHTPSKSLKCLVQETGVSKSSARRATQLLKLRPYKTRLMPILQPHDPPRRVHFCNWSVQSVDEGVINLQLAFFSDEKWFHFQEYINTQNNHH
jgi:hypothetical protein